MQVNARLAAIDLGSNSFHMLIAKATSRGYRILTRQRQKVRLADGLQADLSVDYLCLTDRTNCCKPDFSTDSSRSDSAAEEDTNQDSTE